MRLIKKPSIYDVDVVGLAAVILVGLLAYAGVARPLETRTQTRIAWQQDTSSKQDSLRAELDTARGRLAQQNALAAHLSRTGDVLSLNAGLDTVIGRLDRLAEGYSVSLELVSAELPLPTESCERATLEIRLQGDFSDAMRLMARATTVMPYLRIHTLSIQQKGSSDTACEFLAALHVFSAPAGGAG